MSSSELDPQTMLRIRKRVLSRLYRLNYSAKDKEIYDKLLKQEIEKELESRIEGSVQHKLREAKKKKKI